MKTVISPVNIEDRKKLGLRAGDTVRVWQKVEEGGKTRLQAFEGLVLSRKHGNEAGATFTVRKMSEGVGVEKIFPLFSPNIDKIEILRRAKVKRSKLYHIRKKAAREIRRQMRNMMFVDLSTESETEAEAEEDKKIAEGEEDTKAEKESQSVKEEEETKPEEMEKETDSQKEEVEEKTESEDKTKEDKKEEPEEEKKETTEE